ncbi:carboxypeptidase-like regulatory domain-containing protein [Flavobacteriaceae bacterium]|nr:carboxypeptidase-like regulatory domain-containing protein [Flavobacteriaceae bacterium]
MKNLQFTYLLLFLLASTFSFAQTEIEFTLRGKITSAIDSLALDKTTLIDLSSIEGTLSNKEGLFEIDTKVNDTILISHIGYQSVKLKITNDLSKGIELNIELFPKVEDLEPVLLNKHKLIGVLEVDIKNVPKDKFNRIHINGLPQTYEIKKSSASISSFSASKALTNPVDYIYNLFGRKPKKLRDLQKLKEKQSTRDVLTQRFDREIILDYLQMDIAELTEVLSECNYSPYFIQKATDLQLIEAVLECYEGRKAVKKGKTSNY